MLHDKMTKEELLTLALFDNGGGNPILGTKTLTTNGTYNASDDSLQGYSSVTVDIDDTDLYRDTTDSTYESVKTLSNCGAFPMLSLTAEINAVQDLHGYDKPWAGGAGKNKLQVTATTQTLNGVTFTINSDGTVSLSGTATATFAFPLISGTLSFASDTIITGGYAEASASGATLRINESNLVPSEGYTISANTNITEIAIRVNSGFNTNGVKLYPMIRLSTETDATFAPYSNICPISGWDSIDVYQSGADTSNPTTHTTALSSTCYGGSKDIKGNERFTHAILDLGDLDWELTLTEGKFRTNNFSSYGMKWGSVPLCTQYKGVFKSANIDYGEIAITNSQELPFLRVYDSTKSSMTETEFKEAVRGVKMVYELATPTTATSDAIDLTLAEGVNNIWADSGDVGDARYFKKVEL